MKKEPGFDFGTICGSRKSAFEKDSGIRISKISDGSFVVRAKVFDHGLNKVKFICEVFSSVDLMFDMLRCILNEDIYHVEENKKKNKVYERMLSSYERKEKSKFKIDKAIK